MNTKKLLIEIKKIADKLSITGHQENKILITDEEGNVITSSTSSSKLPFLDNVEEDIDNAIKSKLTTSGHTANKILTTDENGEIMVSEYTAERLENLENTTGDIQESIEGKLNKAGYELHKIISTNESGEIVSSDIDINTVKENTNNIVALDEKIETGLNSIIDTFEPRIVENESDITLIEQYQETLRGEIEETNKRIDNIDGVANVEELTKDMLVVKDDIVLLKDESVNTSKNMLQMLEICKNIKHYGVVGDGVEDDTEFIQQALNDAGNIYIPEGHYKLTNTLIIKSNTTLILHPKAILERMHNGITLMTETSETTLGYSGTENIKIIGGVIKHDSSSVGADVILISHANGVEISGLTIRDTVEGTAINIVGSKNILIEKNIIEGYKFNESILNGTAIGISVAAYNVYKMFDKSSATYDGTVCKNILIKNNAIVKSEKNEGFYNGIGCTVMYNSTSKHEKIDISGNIIEGKDSGLETQYYYAGIILTQVDDLTIENNTIKGFSTAIMFDLQSTYFNINAEEVEEIDFTNINENTSSFGISNAIVSNNKIFVKRLIPRNVVGIWINITNSIFTNESFPKHNNINIINNTFKSKETINIIVIEMEGCFEVSATGNLISGKPTDTGISVKEFSNNCVIKNNIMPSIAEENQIKILANLKGIKTSKRTLWKGTFNTIGSKITLNDEISNYDVILIESNLQGVQFDKMRFDDGVAKSIRGINLADSETSSTVQFYELNVVKKDEKTLELTHNKRQDLETTGLKPPVINSATHVIKKIIGINY